MDRPLRRRTLRAGSGLVGRVAGLVHDDAPEAVELLPVVHLLREEVGDVVRRARGDVGHRDLEALGTR